MNYFIGIITVFLMLNFSGCISSSEIQRSEDFYESALRKTFDASLMIKKDEILKEFNREYSLGEGSSRLNNLALVFANNNYSRSEKNELMIESLERGIIYNILAFNYERRDELVDFFARNELKRDLYKFQFVG